MPTRVPLAPLIALWAATPEDPDAQGSVRTLLRRYLWRSFFTERYEQAAATAALQDYRALLLVARGAPPHVSAPVFDLPLPRPEELITAGWPTRRERLARAVLLLSLQGGALDFADGSAITSDSVGRREYHHLYPRAWLREHGYPEETANRALNCALITARTNRKISANDPVQYLRERAEAPPLGESELRHRLASHAVPFEPLAAGDYERFLGARADVLMDGIETLARGGQWSPRQA